jgi:ribonuclease HII
LQRNFFLSQMIVGVDEAGTGSAIDDIYACAMIYDDSCGIPNITDSKKLTPKKREQAFEAIQATPTCYYGVGIVTRQELDDMGMAKARRLVFVRALEELYEKCKMMVDCVIIDGTIGVECAFAEKVECIPKADFKYPCVSAASIVAKVLRDRKIIGICDANQEMAERYDWKSNKGYLSPKHRDALKIYGMSPLHRKSFTYKFM